MPECMYACTSRVSPEDDRVIEIEHEGEREGVCKGREAVLMALPRSPSRATGRKQLCLNYIEARC